jgi:hypothetical protein
MKNVPLDPITVFDSLVCRTAGGSRGHSSRNGPANFGHGLRPSFPAGLQVMPIFSSPYGGASGWTNGLAGSQSRTGPSGFAHDFVAPGVGFMPLLTLRPDVGWLQNCRRCKRWTRAAQHQSDCDETHGNTRLFLDLKI